MTFRQTIVGKATPCGNKGALIYHIGRAVVVLRSCRRRFVPLGSKETTGKGAWRMAIFHHSIKIISRGSSGKSAVAAAAYRAGEKILCEHDGRISDYTCKGGVVHTEILLPRYAPPEYKDRAVLWNAVEKIEKAKNSQLAREIEIALPVELSLALSKSLVYNYAIENFVRHGMCADIAIHDKGDGNPHAHIMLTMRPFNEDGTWGTKQRKQYTLDAHGEKIYDSKKRQYKCKSIPTTDWNEQTKAEEWRAAWADVTNWYLEEGARVDARIDHRSYKRHGVDQIPTVHLGVAASQMERRGIATEKGNLNREIGVTNQKLRRLKARMVKLQNWLKEETAKAEQPTLADVITNMLEHSDASQSEKIMKLKAAANMLIFLQENDIMDMADLNKKVRSMMDKQSVIKDELKPIDRRLKTLNEHIQQSENYFGFRDIYNEYKKLKPKKQTAFYEAHRREITLYESAKSYLSGAMNGKTQIPTGKWRDERKEKAAAKEQLNREYDVLKNEISQVERIKMNVYDIMNPPIEIKPKEEIQQPPPAIPKFKPKKSRSRDIER